MIRVFKNFWNNADLILMELLKNSYKNATILSMETLNVMTKCGKKALDGVQLKMGTELDAATSLNIKMVCVIG